MARVTGMAAVLQVGAHALQEWYVDTLSPHPAGQTSRPGRPWAHSRYRFSGTKWN